MSKDNHKEESIRLYRWTSDHICNTHDIKKKRIISTSEHIFEMICTSHETRMSSRLILCLCVSNSCFFPNIRHFLLTGNWLLRFRDYADRSRIYLMYNGWIHDFFSQFLRRCIDLMRAMTQVSQKQHVHDEMGYVSWHWHDL